MADICTNGDLGDAVLLVVDGTPMLSDIDSAPSFAVNAVAANTKGNPKSNCWLMERETTDWALNMKVAATSQDAVFTNLFNHKTNRTLCSLLWGPFNQMMIHANVYITNVSPSAATGGMVSATLTAVTQGEPVYQQL